MNQLNPFDHLEDMAKKTNDYVGRHTQSVFGRYPLLFSLLSVFGIVSVLYGFESFISRIPFLGERPLLIFLLGIIILIITGSLYKKLDSRLLD